MKTFYEAEIPATGETILLDFVGYNSEVPSERIFAPHATYIPGNLESIRNRYVESKLDNLREMVLVPVGYKVCECPENPKDVLKIITDKLESYSSQMKFVTDNIIDSTYMLNILSLIPPQKGPLQEEIRLLRVRMGSRKSMKIHEKVAAGLWHHGIPVTKEPTDIGHVVTGFTKNSSDTKEENRIKFTRFTDTEGIDYPWMSQRGEVYNFSELRVVRELKEGE